MSLILTLLIIASILLVLIFIVALRVIFTFNSDEADMHLTLLWLYPFLKAVVTNENTDMILTVYLFKKSILRKTLKKGETKEKTGNMDIIRRVHPRDVNVYTSYGFRDPYITGVACGAISIASQFINIDTIQQDPDFVTDKDYFNIDATAKVNLGSALISLYRARNRTPDEH